MLPRSLFSILAAFALAAAALPARAQYGSGVVLDVPRATGAITLDGNPDEAAWATAPEVDLTAYWDAGWFACCGEPGIPDITARGRMLWNDGVLYVLVEVQDFEPFFFGEEGSPDHGEHLIVGVDFVHQPTDSTDVDESFSGWPDSMPNGGPVAYKVSGAPGVGITANFGYNDVSPADSGWVAGAVFVDDVSYRWGVEMAVYGVEVANDVEIGFNVGGAQAGPESAIEAAGNDANYAYYSWLICDPVPPGANRSCQYAGGTVMSDAGSWATLHLVNTVAGEEGAGSRAFALEPAAPNPFRSATTLTYTMERPGRVELAAYDVLGRRVALVDAGARSAGAHGARFDAAALPAGVYTVRLVVDGAVVATQRVLQTR